MYKKILLPLLTAFCIALTFALPPLLFGFFDKNLLATQQQEDYTIISADGTALSLTQKLMLLSTGDSMHLPFPSEFAELEADLIQQIAALEKLGLLPISILQGDFNASHQSFTEQMLFVKDDQTMRITSVTIRTPITLAILLYCPEEKKILGFTIECYEPDLHEKLTATFAENPRSPETLFFNYLGISTGNTENLFSYSAAQYEDRFMLSLLPQSYQGYLYDNGAEASYAPKYE